MKLRARLQWCASVYLIDCILFEANGYDDFIKPLLSYTITLNYENMEIMLHIHVVISFTFMIVADQEDVLWYTVLKRINMCQTCFHRWQCEPQALGY